ncbi:MAG: hypothetical protein QOD60_1947 [Solirubrobacterales bacterium]|nr:hypothetical protein [Solirubrobacterales bacterium]
MSLIQTSLTAVTTSAPPAGGAAIGQVIGASVAGMIVTGFLLVLGIGHRTGRLDWLGRAGAYAERRLDLPAWAALPLSMIVPSLLIALFGMLWDISIHIDQGRDPGPLANPAHYFILAGLFGIFASGLLAIVLPTSKPSKAAVRISGDWYAPLGGVLIFACGAFSLMGFPLDDIWHRLFGQDVTLWGPTHLMLIGGAVMTILGTAVLLAEAGRSGKRQAGEPDIVYWGRKVSLPGAFLIALSTFQAEFDFGVPQFRFVFAPMLVMLAAAAALVAARIVAGRGGAIGAVLFFLAVRGAYALIIGPILGQSLPHFPLYLPEAILVELVALAISPVRRTLPFALTAGALVGTMGLAAEWGWSHIFSPIPWPSTLLPEGAILGLAMALAGAMVGAWIGARLMSDQIPRMPSLRYAGAVSAALIAALIGFALYKPADQGLSASVALTDVQPGPDRTVNATVTMSPASAADDAVWFNVTAWQGGGLVVDSLRRVREGVYQTTEPIPVHGDWKADIRLQRGNSLIALPIYLPEDPAIPAKGVPASAQFTRPFVADHKVLQREQKSVAGWLTPVAYSVVLVLALCLLGFIAWGIHRIAVVRGEPGSPVAGRSPKAKRARKTPHDPMPVT